MHTTHPVIMGADVLWDLEIITTDERDLVYRLMRGNFMTGDEHTRAEGIRRLCQEAYDDAHKGEGE